MVTSYAHTLTYNELSDFIKDQMVSKFGDDVKVKVQSIQTDAIGTEMGFTVRVKSKDVECKAKFESFRCKISSESPKVIPAATISKPYASFVHSALEAKEKFMPSISAKLYKHEYNDHRQQMQREAIEDAQQECIENML